MRLRGPTKMGEVSVDRRWMFMNPSSIVGSSVSGMMDGGLPIVTSAANKFALEPQPQRISFLRSLNNNSSNINNNNNGIIRSSHVGPTLSINGVGCDIMSQISEITDELYLCGARAMKAQRLLDLGVTHIVNVTVELPPLAISLIESTKIPLDDSPYSNLSIHFDRIADKVEEARRRNGKTVIHCVAGVSRSATLCIAYLIKYKKMSLRQAYHYIKSRRPIIRPNAGFFRQLVEYEQRLLGSASVKMVWNEAAGGYIPDLYEPEYKNTILFLGKYGLPDRLGGRCALLERNRR